MLAIRGELEVLDSIHTFFFCESSEIGFRIKMHAFNYHSNC